MGTFKATRVVSSTDMVRRYLVAIYAIRFEEEDEYNQLNDAFF